MIEGRTKPGTVLFVRARNGKHRVEARFSHLALRRGGRIEVTRVGDLPNVRLVANGRIHRPGLVIRRTLK